MPRRSLVALSVAAGLLLVGCHPPGWGQGDDDGAPDAGAAIDAARGDGGARCARCCTSTGTADTWSGC
ncbi:MAG: hypothetical protein KC464_11525, partial [Myxococcales bacterium]|nr:hypothetical protein [Myxococcales bacterium]